LFHIQLECQYCADWGEERKELSTCMLNINDTSHGGKKKSVVPEDGKQATTS